MTGATGTTFDQYLARMAVGLYESAQDMRTAAMNQIRDVVRKKREGIPFDKVEDEKDPDERSFGRAYDDDNLPALIDELQADGTLTARETEYIVMLLDVAAAAEDVEERATRVMSVTEEEAIYQDWLQHVYGISHTLTARLLHTFGYCGPVRVRRADTDEVVFDEEDDGFDGAVDAVQRATTINRRVRGATTQAAAREVWHDWSLAHLDLTPADVRDAESIYLIEGFPRTSHLWSYCGLTPDQTRRRGERLDYNPQAKTLVWLCADRIKMQGEKSLFKREFYDPYKQQQIERMEHSVCRVCGQPTTEHATTSREPTPDSLGEEFGQVDIEAKQWRACPSDEVPPDEEGLVTLEDFLLAGVDAPEEATPPWTRGHADNRAVRYLGKKFIKHYWYVGRWLQGLETPDDWVVTAGGHDKDPESVENPLYARRQVITPA